MSQMTVGLDLGNHTLKRVRLRSSFRAVEVVDFTCIDLAEDERPLTERMAEALGRLDHSAGQADLLATALPGDVVSVRNLQLPFGDSKRISQIIGFELEGQIPFSLNQVVYDYMRVSQTDRGAGLLVALCQIEQMSRWLDVFQSASQDPRLVGADCLAYASLVEYLPAPEDDGRVGVVDIGHRLTCVCVLGPQGVEFGRTLSSGGHDATVALADAFGLDLEQAEAGKRREGFIETGGRSAATPERVLVSDAIGKFADVLSRELRQTLAAHRSLTQEAVSKLWLCGGGSAIENLDGFLADRLDVEVERLRSEHLKLAGVGRLDEEGETATRWIKGLGLALHAHQGGRRGWLNLRRGPFAFKGDFAAIKGKVLQVAAALVILAVLAIGNALVGYFGLRSTNGSLDQRIHEATLAVLGKPYENIDVALQILREKISPEADPLPRMTALDSLFEIHNRIPQGVKVRLKDINVSPKRIRVEGFTDAFESVEKIKAGLDEYECFTEVRPGQIRKTKDETEVEFELTIVNGC